MTLEMELGVEPARQWRLEVNPGATDTQQRQRGVWLRPQT
jgi:hypothetical protein